MLQTTNRQTILPICFMDEEKERQKEIREKLKSEGIDSDELDEGEQEELADLL